MVAALAIWLVVVLVVVMVHGWCGGMDGGEGGRVNEWRHLRDAPPSWAIDADAWREAVDEVCRELGEEHGWLASVHPDMREYERWYEDAMAKLARASAEQRARARALPSLPLVATPVEATRAVAAGALVFDPGSLHDADLAMSVGCTVIAAAIEASEQVATAVHEASARRSQRTCARVGAQ